MTISIKCSRCLWLSQAGEKWVYCPYCGSRFRHNVAMLVKRKQELVNKYDCLWHKRLFLYLVIYFVVSVILIGVVGRGDEVIIILWSSESVFGLAGFIVFLYYTDKSKRKKIKALLPSSDDITL